MSLPTSQMPPADTDPRRQFATEVVERLRLAGFQALWAGGCVRDAIIGRAPDDYDVATDASPDRVMALFRRTVPVGVSFGVVRVLGPPLGGEVEVATFRTDGRYLDGRRPETVEFGSPREDASRRDFTINGMFFDPLADEVIDYVDGLADLKAGVVRAIGNPVERFTEDKLRLLRAVRFAARFGFAIEPATRAAVEQMADQIQVVAAERIAQELRKVLTHPSRRTGMALVHDTGLARTILPELVPLRGLRLGAPSRPDTDVWDHTLAVLEQLPCGPSFPLALGALWHDVGKAVDCSKHPGIGAKLADERARALRLANAERERAVWLVVHHHDLRDPRALRRSQFKTILSAPGAEELIALEEAHSRAIGTSLEHVRYCESYRRDEPDGPLAPPPLITGDDLVRLGLSPGPRFKTLLDQARELQLEGDLPDRDTALRWLENETH